MVQPIWTLDRMPPSPRHTSSTSLPPGNDKKIVRQLATISSSVAAVTPSAARRCKGALSRSAASTCRPLFLARLRHIGSPMVPTPMNPMLSVMSVHDEEFGAHGRLGAMGEVAVGHLVALAGLQHHRAPVGQLGVQLAFQHQQDMALLAPMVGEVARRVLDDAHADIVEILGAPERLAGLAGMFRALHTVPVGRAEGYVEHQHAGAFSTVCAWR